MPLSTITTWAATRPEPLGSSWFMGSPAHGGCWHTGPNNSNPTPLLTMRSTALFIIISRQKETIRVQSTWQAKQFPPVHCKLQGTLNPGQVALSRKAGMPRPEVEKICEKGKHMLLVSCCNKDIYHSPPVFWIQDSNSDYFFCISSTILCAFHLLFQLHIYPQDSWCQHSPNLTNEETAMKRLIQVSTSSSGLASSPDTFCPTVLPL